MFSRFHFFIVKWSQFRRILLIRSEHWLLHHYICLVDWHRSMRNKIAWIPFTAQMVQHGFVSENPVSVPLSVRKMSWPNVRNILNRSQRVSYSTTELFVAFISILWVMKRGKRATNCMTNDLLWYCWLRGKALSQEPHEE